jgi:hypothetical protein
VKGKEYEMRNMRNDKSERKPKLSIVRDVPDMPKRKFSLIPVCAIEAEIDAFELGRNGRPYGDWKTAYKSVDEVLDKVYRHLMAHQKGKELDESGATHLGHAKADLSIAIWMIQNAAQKERP